MWSFSIFASLALLVGPESGASTVRANLDRAEHAAARNYYAQSEQVVLPAAYAPAVLAQVPTIRHAAVMRGAADWFAKYHYVRAVPVLIQSLDRKFISNSDTVFPLAERAIASFGADAVPYLIQACRHGSANQIAICARLLSDLCVNKPADARVIRLMVDLTKAVDTRLRRVGVTGLWRATVIFHDWSMDNIHFVEIFRSDLLRYIIDAACDSDRDTAAVARGFLFRLVWQSDGSLAPADRSSNEAPWDINPAKFDRALGSKQAEVRAAALVVETYDAGLDQIRFKALSDPDPLVFHAAVASSRLMIRKESMPLVIKLASSPSAQLRRAAGFLLAASYDPTAKPTLRLLAADSDPNVRYSARFSW